MRFSRQQAPKKLASPPRQPSRPYRTGYEAYQKPNYMPDLQVNASLWGTTPQKPTRAPGQENAQTGGLGAAAAANQSSRSAGPAKKMMSLEEVEAAMHSQAKKPNPSPGPQQQAQVPPPRSGQDPNYNLPYNLPQPSTIIPPTPASSGKPAAHAASAEIYPRVSGRIFCTSNPTNSCPPISSSAASHCLSLRPIGDCHDLVKYCRILIDSQHN